MFFLPAILSAQKEKPSEINDSRGFVVAGVVGFNVLFASNFVSTKRKTL